MHIVNIQKSFETYHMAVYDRRYLSSTSVNTHVACYTFQIGNNILPSFHNVKIDRKTIVKVNGSFDLECLKFYPISMKRINFINILIE